MLHIRFWFMFMMLTHWVQAYMLIENKTRHVRVTHSWDHCWNGTQYVVICVLLHYLPSMHRILSPVACATYFLTLSHTKHDFREKCIEHKSSDFLYNFCPKQSSF